MKQITITVYTIDELSPEAKQKAIEKIRGFLRETFEPSDLTQWFDFELLEKGLPNLECCWSLSYCQGDGVAFYGTVDIDALLHCEACKEIHPELRYLREVNEPSIKIGCNNRRYTHCNTMYVDIDVEDYYDDRPQVNNFVEERIETVKDFLSEYVKEVSKELEKIGYEYIEGSTNEEQALEYAQDLHFLKDGTRFEVQP